MTRSFEGRFPKAQRFGRGLLAAVALAAALAVPAIAQTATDGSTAPATEPAPNTATIDLTVDGLQSNDGMLLWALYQGQEKFETFDETTAFVKGKCKIVEKICNVQIPNIPFGEYAFLVAHDVDNNGEIDRNPLSSELKGVSNYTSKLWWKPNWDDAHFKVDQPEMKMTITVH